MLISMCIKYFFQFFLISLKSDIKTCLYKNINIKAYNKYSIISIKLDLDISAITYGNAKYDIITNIEVKNATKDTKQLDVLSSETVPVLVNNSDNFENIETKIDLNNDIKAPIMQGDKLGSVTYSVNGVEYTTELIASHDVKALNIPIYLIIAFGIFVILFIIYRIFYHVPKK